MKQKDTCRSELQPKPQSPYDEAYIQFLVHFHADRDYFECHEIMEEHWKANPDSKYRAVWLGLIQVAVSQYHERRQNIKGAAKMMASAISHLQAAPVEELGLDEEMLINRLTERLGELKRPLANSQNRQDSLPDGGSLERRSFADLNLPLRDERLKQACIEACHERGMVWLKASDLSAAELIHKHTARDRSEVVRERARRLKEKRLARGQS